VVTSGAPLAGIIDKLLVGIIDKLKFVGHGLQFGKLPNDRLNVAPHHRLASREANLLYAQANKDLANILDFFVGEHLLFWSDRRLAVRQAVEASKVAPVSQRNAQIADCPAVRIFELCGHFFIQSDNNTLA
jgi:hypothetical protein